MEKYTNVIAQPKGNMRNKTENDPKGLREHSGCQHPRILAMVRLTQQGNLASARTSGRRGPSLHSVTFSLRLFLLDSLIKAPAPHVMEEWPICSLSQAGLGFYIYNLSRLQCFCKHCEATGQK